MGIVAMNEELKRNNRRVGLTLAAIVVVFFIGFMARMVLLGG